MKNSIKIIIAISAIITIFTINKNCIVTKSINRQSENITKEAINQITPNKELKYNDRSVPVLMYHSIAFEKGNELRVPKEKFREQMKFLKDSGYTTLTMDEVYAFFVNDKPVPLKSVVITFDDGYEDNYLNAYPVLKEFDLKATIFVITANIDKNKASINSQQLKEMQKNGIDIESHTVNHQELNKMSYLKQLDTLKKSKDEIERLLDKKVLYLSYPIGKWNNETIEAAKNAGYKMAFTTKNSWTRKENGIYTLNRVRISSSYGISEFKNILKN